MLKGFLEESMMARAVKKGAVKINIIDLKDYGIGRWKKTDDKPYGGGPGMLMRCEPWFAAVEDAVRPSDANEEVGVRNEELRIIMTSPAGKRWTQRDAEMFAGMGKPRESLGVQWGKPRESLGVQWGKPRESLGVQWEGAHLVFLCGHYEGFDARIETLVTDKYSIGDFVMTGGELAAAAMVDSIVRLLPGVLGGGPAATASESFGRDGGLECPQYTHPPEFRGMKVPEVLLSGDHAKIERWRQSEARKLTERDRPDLIGESSRN